ncbi:MAG TPA: hypothetical protein VNU72_12360 [Puia sp.]|nr:hypothetical protein [Puia sp.]
MANSNKSSGLQSLDAEIRTLKQKARQLETKIDDNFNYFQQHSGSLFIRSLLPRKTEEEAITGNPLLDTFLRNERLQKILMRLADRLAEKLGDGLNWLVNRVFRKE